MVSEIDLPATAYGNYTEYGLVTYIKTAIWVYLFEIYLGQDKLDAAMQAVKVVDECLGLLGLAALTLAVTAGLGAFGETQLLATRIAAKAG